MYQHQPHQSHSNLLSSRTAFPSERHLFLQRGTASGESGLVLSTDAKPRLKWTAELHDRFIDAVNQLGGADKATPKAIMRLMGIPGLTLYHLKSHLQKYRLGKNLQAQTNTGSIKNFIGCTLPAERTIQDSGSAISMVAPANKTMQINEALKMQIEVQQKLHQQLEVQRHMQFQIEAQGKYLQSVLEKAQETLTKQSFGSAGLEVAKSQLSELVSKVSSECFSSSFQSPPGRNTLQLNPAQLFADCSVDSCLTSSEGPQQEQDAQDAIVGLTTSREGFPLTMKQFRDHTMLEQKSSSTLADTERTFSPVNRDISITQASFKSAREKEDGRRKEWVDEDTLIKLQSSKRSAVEGDSRKVSDGLVLPFLTTELELKIHGDKEGGASSCKQFDLNGFSWN